MSKSAPPKQRGSRDLWLAGANELLVTRGIDGVNIMALSRHLNLSRTGFYWFFKDLEELHIAMAEHWEVTNTSSIIERCEMPADNLCEAMFNLIDCWLDSALFDADLDMAIRDWARKSKAIKQRLDAVDHNRIEAVTAVFLRHGYTPEQAQVRGATVICTQTGYFSMDIQEDPDERLRRVQYYVELFAGEAPSQEDIAAFHDRHRDK
ncbi:TetR/AcrR family transcriptional regulator [Shimia sp. MMG029]|uniref:TetR/AcrR family transcriptional regulator n=1 Tax=Shimia sp. MMG029 TaxID=3021978 RepID=UPI0022FE8311|nr:TetR/AcrR family transcriptional regulator [Shimia sp. MMG029]MDA5558565.1 TetR/AcrR family transcriptional regulator [Shimia sp. MMG029]